MWRVIRRGLAARKFRLITTSTSILLGVAFMVGTLILSDTIGNNFNKIFADVYKGTDAWARSSNFIEGDFSDDRDRVDQSVIDAAAKVPGVAVAQGTIRGFGIKVVGSDHKVVGSDQGPPNFGYSWIGTSKLNPFRMASGREPAASGEIVVDRGVAKKGHLAIGDQVTVLTKRKSRTFTLVGLVTFGSQDSAGGTTNVLFTAQDAQTYISEPGKFDAVAVSAEPGVSQSELQSRLRQAFAGQKIEVLTGAQITAEQQDQIQKALGFFTTFLLVLAFVSLFVGAFIIFNTFSIVVAQRAREMAMLRAIGAGKTQVLASVVAEAVATGLIASLFGVAGGIGAAYGIRALLNAAGLDLPTGGLVVTSTTCVVAVLVGTGVTALSATVPAWRASRVPPVTALRDVAIDHSGTSMARLISGLGVLAGGVLMVVFALRATNLPIVGAGAALTFLGVAWILPVVARPIFAVLGRPVRATRGVAGALATENARRNPRRSAATASALTIGVGLVAFIVIFSASARASINAVLGSSFRGDIAIDSGSFVGGLSPDLTKNISALPEVDTATSLRVTAVGIRLSQSPTYKTRFVIGVDPAKIAKVFDIKPVQGSVADLGIDGIAVQSDIATREGWSIGSPVRLKFLKTGEQTFTVRTLFALKLGQGGFIVSQAALDTNVADNFDSQIFVTVKPGQSVTSTLVAVKGACVAYPNAKVQDRATFIASQGRQIDQILALVTVLLTLAILIAVIGIANTLALSIWERRRELGLLRAIGAQQAQLRSSVRWESVLIALLGTTLGIGVGIFFGWAMLQAVKDRGLTQFAAPPTRLGMIVIAGLVFGVIAAIRPARKAAKVDMLASISFE